MFVTVVFTALSLIALALPAVSLNLGFNSGSAAIPRNAEGRYAVELIEEDFAGGVLEPAIVVVDAKNVQSPAVQRAVNDLLSTVEGDDAFAGPFEVRPNADANALIVRVPIVGGTGKEQAERAVTHLRDIVATTFAGSGSEAYVTGQTAGSLDFKNHMYGSAPS